MTAGTLREKKRDREPGGLGTERRQTLPEYLRQLRVSSHYRQNFVASRLNISRQTYSHYETGRIRPPAGALYGLARLYGIPVENLLSCMMFGRCGLENREEGRERRPEEKGRPEAGDSPEDKKYSGGGEHPAHKDAGKGERPEQNKEDSGDGNPAENKKDLKNLKKGGTKEEGKSSLEIRLLTHFRSLTLREQEDILSIMELKIKDRGEKENQDAERKVTV